MTVGDSTLKLPASPTAASIARAFIRGCWSDLETAGTIEAVALCVSELVTNALDHAQPPFELRVQRSGGRLRVEVADNTASAPELRSASAMERRGRGILIVDKVATQWGVEPTHGGKTVWAEFVTST